MIDLVTYWVESDCGCCSQIRLVWDHCGGGFPADIKLLWSCFVSAQVSFVSAVDVEVKSLLDTSSLIAAVRTKDAIKDVCCCHVQLVAADRHDFCLLFQWPDLFLCENECGTASRLRIITITYRPGECIDQRFFFFATSFSGSQSWRHTQSLLKCTNSLSGRIWRNMDFLSVCWLCLALSCLFSWCQCFERWRDFTSGCCSSLQRMNSGSYGPASPECWIEVIGPKTRRFMWAQILSMQATKKGRFMKNVF